MRATGHAALVSAVSSIAPTRRHVRRSPHTTYSFGAVVFHRHQLRRVEVKLLLVVAGARRGPKLGSPPCQCSCRCVMQAGPPDVPGVVAPVGAPRLADASVQVLWSCRSRGMGAGILPTPTGIRSIGVQTEERHMAALVLGPSVSSIGSAATPRNSSRRRSTMSGSVTHPRTQTGP